MNPFDRKAVLKQAEEDKQKHHSEQMANSIKYDGHYVKTVEIPLVFTKAAWDKVDAIVSSGYTIKGVVERESMGTSIIILEKIN